LKPILKTPKKIWKGIIEIISFKEESKYAKTSTSPGPKANSSTFCNGKEISYTLSWHFTIVGYTDTEKHDFNIFLDPPKFY